MRIKVELAYDGTDFSGWAAQPGLRTVETVLAEGLGRALRLPEAPRLTVAGRTDAGVHARGQMVHADVPDESWAATDAQACLRRLGGALPPDVRVTAVEEAPAGFDARFSALWRRYSYRVCDDPAAADPLRRRDTLWYFRGALDLPTMNAAAAGLIGEHDFAAFCRRREGASTVRELRVLEWDRTRDITAVARVIADAFCHNMVRSLVGAMLVVGTGVRSPDWPARVLAAGVRDPRVPVVAPHGLCLEEVRYPPAAELEERAAQTRRHRTGPGPNDASPSPHAPK